jgi:hypothetical protein
VLRRGCPVGRSPRLTLQLAHDIIGDVVQVVHRTFQQLPRDFLVVLWPQHRGSASALQGVLHLHPQRVALHVRALERHALSSVRGSGFVGSSSVNNVLRHAWFDRQTTTSATVVKLAVVTTAVARVIVILLPLSAVPPLTSSTSSGRR